jgi:putative phage-type endonuclease
MESNESSRLEWLRWRKKGIGASDVPSIMGVSPYRSIHDVYLDKISDVIEEKTSYIMELGNTLEPIARSYYELEKDADYPAANFVHTTTPHFRCSLDGFNRDLNRAIEIKYIGKNFFEECPVKYVPQIQYQYAVTLCDEIDLVQINNMNQIKTFLVKKDIEYIKAMIERVDWFWDCVINKKEDEILAAMPPKKERKARKKKGDT